MIGIIGADYSPESLPKLTDSTGGRIYEGYRWADIAAKISIELRNQYVVGYRSKNHALQRTMAQNQGETSSSARPPIIKRLR
jgi:hypothetical protein